MKQLNRILTIACLILSVVVQAQKNEVLKYSMKTRWSDQMDKSNPWPEYPRPQLSRDTYWQSLNGKWEYAIAKKGKSQPKKFDGNILVPFAVESELSGVKKLVGQEHYLWYRRLFDAADLAADERLILHFGAVDWEAVVYLNGEEVGSHRGGYDAFEFDLTDHLRDGQQELVIRVWDPSDKGTQPRGKQVSDPFGIWYTPVTGIWQTVWLEKTPAIRITNLKLTPNIDTRQLDVQSWTNKGSEGLRVEVIASADGKVVSTKSYDLTQKSEQLSIEQPRLWSPEDPFLYDLRVRLIDANGKTLDQVDSYFGMRKISLGKDANGYTRILLNNRPLFQFGLLDQGWWPDGLYTAPTEEAMLYDVKMTKEMGFNMIRKHVKVEPARYYYHCDRMGMLVWQDMPNGNYLRELRIEAWEEEDANRPKESAVQFEAELKEMMDQFHSFPSILVWVPFNEGWGQYDTERVTKWVTEYDPSRLIDSPSGWADRGVGDMIDIHLYPGPGMEPVEENRAAVLGEFGGLGYPVKDHLWWDKKNWGYLTFHDEDTYVREFEKLMKGLQGLVGSGLSGAIYTQTTDVEGEVNGLITYDREVTKVAPEKLRKLIAPLYSEYWSARRLVRDSEQEANQWKVSFTEPDQKWRSIQYDDFNWDTQDAPFSSYENPFLPNATEWSSDKLYARKTFSVNTIPSTMYLRHYLPKAGLKLWLNGTLIFEQKDQGGRKRHYTDVAISEWLHLLKTGKNVLTAEVTRQDEKASFDVGIYATEQVQPIPDKAQKAMGTTASDPAGN